MVIRHLRHVCISRGTKNYDYLDCIQILKNFHLYLKGVHAAIFSFTVLRFLSLNAKNREIFIVLA